MEFTKELKMRRATTSTFFIELEFGGEEGAIILFTATPEKTEANAQELVRRWNSHKDLLAACESVVLGLECLRLSGFPPCKEGDYCCVCQSKAAIASARS